MKKNYLLILTCFLLLNILHQPTQTINPDLGRNINPDKIKDDHQFLN